MGNLGAYQVMTTIAKRVGGPKNLVGILISSGIAIGVGLTKSGEFIVNNVRKIANKNTSLTMESAVFTVTVGGIDNSGLEFSIGDKFKVLECDGEAILIEKIGDLNNPYFVPDEFLLKISDDYARRNKR